MAIATLSTGISVTDIRLASIQNLKEAWTLLHEYFEAVGVIVRDNEQAIASYLTDADSGFWIAYSHGEAAGCIGLRPLPGGAGEVKRLYVRPAYRRRGIAQQLLRALEAHAAALGVPTLYLDSKDDLREALAFYQNAGYLDCPRYNNNPQATVFLLKQLASAFQLRPFATGDEDAFRDLNDAWISKLFKLEEKDLQTLREPQKYILSKGGRIYMACRGDRAVGCCALLRTDDGSYEVSKMGVAESERGQGVGRALLVYLIADAKRSGITRLYLETHHSLKNAIHLYQAAGFTHLRPEDVKPSPYVRADVYMELPLR